MSIVSWMKEDASHCVAFVHVVCSPTFLVIGMTGTTAMRCHVSTLIWPTVMVTVYFVKSESWCSIVSHVTALRWLRGTTDVQSELRLIKSEFDSQKSAPRVTLGQMLTNPMLRIPLTIAVVIMLAQQLSGINAVSFTTATWMELEL